MLERPPPTHRLLVAIGWGDPHLTVRELIVLALAIFGVGLAAAIVDGAIDPGPRGAGAALATYLVEGRAAGEAALVEHLTDHADDAEAWLLLVDLRRADGPGGPPYLDEASLDEFLETSTDPGPRALRARLALRNEGLAAALERLGPAADDAGDQRAVGDLARAAGDLERSLVAYRAAVALDPDDPVARRSVIEVLLETGRPDEAVALLDDPAYGDAVDPGLVARLRLALGDRAGIVVPIVESDLLAMAGQPVHLAGAIAVGAAWYLVLLQLGWAVRWSPTGRRVAGAALVLGFASATAVLPVVVLTDRFFDTGAEASILENLLRCLVGIGLREELFKALFLVPLLPYLARVDDSLQVLVTCALVGLGFAINENVLYYQTSGGQAVVSRFLTASFLHMVLTGTIGFHAVRALRQPTAATANDAALVFVQMVVAHGVYDFILIDPRLAGLSIAAGFLFIWLSQVFLRLILDLSPRRRRPIPVTRPFVAALALGAAVGLFLAARAVGLRWGLQGTAHGLLGSAIIAIMYFLEFDESAT